MVNIVMNPPENSSALRPGLWVPARKGQLVSRHRPRSAFDVRAGATAYSGPMKRPAGFRLSTLSAVAA